MSLTLWWMTIPSGKESRDNMDGGFPQQIYSIDCHYWNTNVSWQGLAAIITRENEGIGSMYLNLLWFASKEFAADSCVLSWIPLPWQDLFLLQCSVEKMTLDSPTDGRHSNSEADNFILGPWENLVIAVPQFICLDEGGRFKLYFHSQLLILGHMSYLQSDSLIFTIYIFLAKAYLSRKCYIFNWTYSFKLGYLWCWW